MLIVKHENIFNNNVPANKMLKHQCFGHGCNIYNNMGAGIALVVKNIFPDLYLKDSETIQGDKDKLGNFTFFNQDDKLLFNLYTQETYWNHAKMFKIEYLEKSLSSAIEYAYSVFNNKIEFAIPAIGLGLANGLPSEVIQCLQKISEKYSNICDIYLYVLDTNLYKTIQKLIT